MVAPAAMAATLNKLQIFSLLGCTTDARRLAIVGHKSNDSADIMQCISSADIR